ncbi:MAG: FlgD immunoglobulin-like domain containing protein [bacterium]
MRTAPRLSSRMFTFVLIAVLTAPQVLRASIEAHAQSFFVNERAGTATNTQGSFSSLVLDAQGTPHVSYNDGTVGNLEYGRRQGGAWTFETADGSAAVVGQHTSMFVSASGLVRISYYDATNGDLKLATKSASSWSAFTLDGSSGDVGQHTSIGEKLGSYHVSYYDVTNGDLKYADFNGVQIAASIDNVGQYSSLALDAQNFAHIACLDASNENLVYLRRVQFAWLREAADASAQAVGYYSSLVLDAQGNPHVSYHNNSTLDLQYARKSGGAWIIEIADGSANNTGHYCSLELDAQGNPCISHLNLTTNDLLYTRKSGGVWTTVTADGSANSVGHYSSLDLDAHGNPHVSYLDNTTGDLMYANAAVRVVAPNTGVTWAVGSMQNIAWAGVGPVDILVSADGGSTFERRETGVTTSPWAFRVPHVPTRFAKIRIERASPLSASESEAFFTIDGTIALAKFEANRDAMSDATRLTWETSPGPEADIRYRVERASSDAGAFASLHSDLLDRGEFVDIAPAAGARYRLVAVNGLGDDYVLGETSVASDLAEGRRLAVSPNPAPGGNAGITFRVPYDPDNGASGAAIDLSVYDVSGRRVRALASGVYAAGVRTLQWDGQDDAGRSVAAGLYFLRLSSPARIEATERVVVVR